MDATYKGLIILKLNKDTATRNKFEFKGVPDLTSENRDFLNKLEKLGISDELKIGLNKKILNCQIKCNTKNLFLEVV